jgi:hypothetical protein
MLPIAEFDECWQKGWRKIINAEIACVLKGLQRVRLSRTRQPTNDN